MKTIFLLFIAIIALYTFTINSDDHRITVTDFNVTHKDNVQSMFEDHWEELAFTNKEQIPSLFSLAIEDQSLIKKVLMKDDNVIGYLDYTQIHRNPNIWAISGVVIDKEHQNKGYGKQFIQNSLDDILKRKGEIACLIVLKSNKQARNLYENKLGFKFNPAFNRNIPKDCIGLSLEFLE